MTTTKKTAPAELVRRALRRVLGRWPGAFEVSDMRTARRLARDGFVRSEAEALWALQFARHLRELRTVTEPRATRGESAE